MGERLNGLGLRSRVARSLSLKRKTSVSSPASTPKTDKSQQKDSHRASCSLQENPSLPPLPPLPLGTTTVSAETAALPEQPRSSTSSSSSRTSSTPRGSGNVLGGMRSSSPLSTPPINAEATSATPAPPSHPTHKKGQRSHDVCSSIKPASNLNGHPLRPSRSDESLVTEPRRPTVPPRLQSTARGAPIGPPLPLMPSPPSYSLSPPPGSSLRMPPQAERREDPLQNVHDHMRAREDLLGHGPFFTVQRGWKKGVYTSREEADKQIRNFPGPVMKEFENVDEALAFLSPPPPVARASSSSSSEEDEDDLDRHSFFRKEWQRDSSADLGSLRRTTSLSSPRTSASQRIRQRTNQVSSPWKLRSPTDRHLGSLPPSIEDPELNPPSAFRHSTLPAFLHRSMSLLPVKNLSNSISFYESVLDFTLVSRHENAQAILISGGGRKSDGSGDGPNWNPGGAAICLRSLDHAPAAPPGSGLSRGGSISRNGNLGRSQSIKRPARTPPLLETSPEAAISEPAPDTAAQSPASKQAPDSPSSKTTSEGANLGVVSSSTSGAVVASGCNASSAAASATSAKPKPAAPPPPPPRSGTFTLSGISVLLEHAGPLEGFLTGMEAKMDRWGAGSRNSVASCNDVSRQESRKGDGARVLGGVEKKPWGSQELHVSDPDGHRLIFTAPLESPVYTEFEQPTSYLKL